QPARSPPSPPARQVTESDSSYTPPCARCRFAVNVVEGLLPDGDAASQARHKATVFYAAGRLNQKRVSRPSESAPTRPPDASTSCLTIASPIPAPPRAASRDFSTR